MTRKLGIARIAVSLISVHYGLGFLLGTSEAVYTSGVSGILYPIACALGLIFLSLLAPFYWKNKYPIWTLLGSLYGENVRRGVSILSWVWMVGIVASQVLGATFILSILGIPPLWGVVFTTAAIAIISLCSIKKLSSIFFILLGISSLTLVLGIFKLESSMKIVGDTSLQIIPSIISLDPKNIMGIVVPTILVTVLGMDFHQFIVRGKSQKKAIWGTIIAGLALLLIALLPTSVVITAIRHNILPAGIDGKEVIPFILLYVGSSLGSKAVGYSLVFALLAAALGSGSGVSKILIKTLKDIALIPKLSRKPVVAAIINSIFIFILALTGKTIISLIVSFYSIYVAGVSVAFLAYLLQRKKIITVPKNSIYACLLLGGGVSFSFLILSKINLVPTLLKKNTEFWIITLGMLSASIPLIIPSRAWKWLIGKSQKRNDL